jgi:hypothetical protein
MTGGSNILRCRVCGGGLPTGAMFCGECGSAARHPGWMDASRDRPVSRTEARAQERVPAHGRHASGGAAAPSRVPVERARPVPAPESETTVRTGNDRASSREQEPISGPVLELRPEARKPEEEPEFGQGLWLDADPLPVPEPAWLSEPDPERPEAEQPQPEAEQGEQGEQAEPQEREGSQREEPERSASAPTPASAPVPATTTTTVTAPAYSPELVPAHLADDRHSRTDRPAEPAAAGADTAPRQAVCGSVIARFSTGETVTLHGTGLLGRNPSPQEGERFDLLVRIHDPARSVSKTHLEFMVDAGRVWIRDRHSGNGTMLRHPNGTGSRCEAGRRYRVQDGDRVEIGEQFFDLR